MNKDLDERLIPNGEYRDALNLDIANSDGSNVGTLQNVKGNVEIKSKEADDNGWQTNYISDLTNPVCVGSIRHDKDEKIYWFIASDEASVIAEYDQTNNFVKPVLVDKNSILNFSADYLITGINILDNFLTWTDDQTEPKKININKFKAGSTDFATHTVIPIWNPNTDTYTQYIPATQTRPAFVEEDTTTIKKSPLLAPTINAAASKFGEDVAGTGITPVITFADAPVSGNTSGNENFTYIVDTAQSGVYASLPTYNDYIANVASNPNYYQDSNLPSGWDGLVTFDVTPIYDLIADNGQPVWKPLSKIILSARYVTKYNEAYTYKINLLVESLSNETVTGKIQAISSNILKPIDDNEDIVIIEWEAVLEEEDPMFEYIFPRFAYRWKYIDNEYSTISPFSSVAFIGDEFAYLSTNGYNVGMTNNIRSLVLDNLTWGSDEVSEIEILYKESNNTSIYSVDTIRKQDYAPYTGIATLPTEFRIESETIGSVLQGNQLLRPWDNVPRLAKTQEIIGNRLVYANYLQNYDIPAKIELNVVTSSSDHSAGERLPEGSLKSIRTYQAGVVFKDSYGRETPIFTTKNASTQVDISNAAKTNKLIVSPSGDYPDWATHYKFFIKETSNQYYNLSLDRFYFAEDGNIWLSFPSSERNKIDEETYLFLKKQHDNDQAVLTSSKYKVISIQNSAPDFIATTTLSIAESPITLLATSPPGVDVVQFRFDGPTVTANAAFHGGIVAENVIQLSDGASATQEYDISSGGPTGTGNEYTVTLAEPLGPDAGWISSYTTGDTIIATIKKKVVERLPEFEGRFFAKINRDASFDTNVIDSFSAFEKRYGILLEADVDANIVCDPPPCSGGGDSRTNLAFYDQKAVNAGGGSVAGQLSPPTQNQDWFGVGWSNFKGGSDSPINVNAKSHPLLDQYLQTSSALLRFKNDAGDYSEVYTITGYTVNAVRRRSSCLFGQRRIGSNARKQVRVTLDRDFETGFGTAVSIEMLKLVNPPGNRVISSPNPAIFETEPKEAVDLDIYNEATGAFPIAEYNTSKELDYFNCYSYGNGVESNRIRDDYNANTIDKGPKVSAPLDEPYAAERRGSGFIFSQIYNSTSGVNRLNQFIQAEAITKDLNPSYGTIQKLHARDTDLIALCEDKCLRILANKDALYNADGNVNLTGNNAVLGQAVPYAGEFGISKNPESFASYGFRAYFTDKNRGAVIRLSMDGITNIADKGMSSFFNDNLRVSTNLIGSYDEDKNIYNLTLDNISQQWINKLSPDQDYQLNPDCNADQSGTMQTTVSYKESVDGWTSRKSFIPESGLSLNNTYYTFKNGVFYEHGLNVAANNFYGVQYDSSFNVIINEQPQIVKGFSTVNYTGTQSKRLEYQYDSKWYSLAEINFNKTVPTAVRQKQPGWYVNYVKTDLEGGEVKEFEKKEGKYFNYIKALEVFNDCEVIGEGIGTSDNVVADPQDYILTITIDETCSPPEGALP